MASKPPNTILKYFKALLDLHQPILTRSILEILHAVGDNPTLQLKSDVLLDLMCSLGLSVSTERKAGDEMASIAWLLNVGTRKIYSQNKNICVVKLPLVFTSLGDILASDFEEARFSAVEAFKGLIDNCIDENLVSQGITQIKARHQGLIYDPTVIEKICAILEGLLNVRYSDVWDKSFHVTGLARLTYEFSELIGVAYKLLPSTFLLMQRNNQEIVKANLGFIKALVAKSKADVLHEHLKGVVEGLFSWQSDTKNSFKAKRRNKGVPEEWEVQDMFTSYQISDITMPLKPLRYHCFSDHNCCCCSSSL